MKQRRAFIIGGGVRIARPAGMPPFTEREIERSQRMYELLFGFHEEKRVMTFKELAARLREGMEANNWHPVQEVIEQLEAAEAPAEPEHPAAAEPEPPPFDEDEPEPEPHAPAPRSTSRHPVRGRRK